MHKFYKKSNKKVNVFERSKFSIFNSRLEIYRDFVRSFVSLLFTQDVDPHNFDGKDRKKSRSLTGDARTDDNKLRWISLWTLFKRKIARWNIHTMINRLKPSSFEGPDVCPPRRRRTSFASGLELGNCSGCTVATYTAILLLMRAFLMKIFRGRTIFFFSRKNVSKCF